MSLKKLLDLSGKVALVTGGSRGLGLQMAEALGEMGARVALTARKAAELDAAVKHLASQGVEAMAIPVDLGRRENIPGVVDAVAARFGTVDILVNNAGTTWGAPAEDHPAEAWDKVMRLNIDATVLPLPGGGAPVLHPAPLREDRERGLGVRPLRQPARA